MSPEKRLHTSTHYDQQLRTIEDKLLLMGRKAEQMTTDAISALVERSPALAMDVIRRDDSLDRLEIEVDDRCISVLALEQPVAGDLRFITTSLKIVRDIERIGDIAVNIAERSLELLQDPPLKPLNNLSIMAHRAQHILKGSLRALVEADIALARRVIREDRRIDSMNQQIFRELLTYMIEDARNVSRSLKLMFVAKHLERIGDHSSNIAEMVIFMVRGEDVRHETPRGASS